MDKSLLKRALSDSEEPTPGYMFRDITQWTFLDHTTQTKLVAALFERLKPNATVHVLAKTLRMVKHLCENGHTDFQKEIQRSSETLKQFANFRGPNDPKFGDKLNEKVRLSAKEAVDAAFAPRKEQKLNITGEGGNTTYKEEKGGFTTGVKIGGAKSGDPHMSDMPTTNKWAEHMAKGGGTVTEENSFTKAVKTGFATGFGMRQESIKTNEQRMREEMTNTGSYQAIDLNQGFASANTDTGASTGGWKFTEESTGGSASALPKESTRMLTPLQKEVEKLASYKNTPQRVEITQFIETIQEIINEGNFTFEDLAEAMDAQLAQKHPWQSRLNVLSAVEAIARGKMSVEFNNYFTENPEDIQRNVHVVQASLKERASKVLKILGIPERSAGTATVGAQQTTTALNQGETHWSAPVSAMGSAPDGASIDFDGMAETAPRRKKTGEKTTDKAPTLKKRAIVQDDSNSWGGTTTDAPASDWGTTAQGWGTAPTTAEGSSWGTAPTAGGSAWGSDWGTTATAQPTSQPPPVAQQPPMAQQAPPAKKNALDDMDAFFSSGGNSTLQTSAPAPGQPVWGSAPPADTRPAPVWGPAPTPPTANQQPLAFDPLSLPAPKAAAQAPPPPAALPPQMTQMMEMLNQQMQQIMASAANNPNAAGQIQMLMTQQQQLMQQMMAMQQQQQQQQPPHMQQQYTHQPHPQQQANRQEASARADHDFAVAAQQMRQQMAKH